MHKMKELYYKFEPRELFNLLCGYRTTEGDSAYLEPMILETIIIVNAAPAAIRSFKSGMFYSDPFDQANIIALMHHDHIIEVKSRYDICKSYTVRDAENLQQRLDLTYEDLIAYLL